MLPYSAAIFDLDGTLTDNMVLHRRAFAQLFAERGLAPLPADYDRRFAGKRNDEIFPALLGREVSGAELAELAEAKEARYRELAAGELQAVEGLYELLDLYDRLGVRYAVATSAPRENVPVSLGALGLGERIRTLVLGSDVPRSKPAPDIFLEAARRLEVAPARCIVFEDAYAGIEAAHAAGMTCIALSTTFSLEQLATHGLADLIVPNFAAYLDHLGLG